MNSKTQSPYQVGILGVPYDERSSFLRGAAAAPPLIRAAFRSPSANLSTENGQDLGAQSRLVDLGDLEVSGGLEAVDQIRAGAQRVLDAGHRLLSLGGDHAITYPLIQAYARRFPGLTILQIDAHPDLYDEFEGDRLSHACPFARILDQGLARRLVQVGIRTMTPMLRAQAERFGVEVIEMRSWSPNLALDLEGPLYLSLDMDALDPAFAPGISHYEPGGFSTREVLGIIQRLPVAPVGADIVEYNPGRDVEGVTAMVAAKFMKEIVAVMLAEGLD